jgi:MFS family permease
MAMSAAPGQRPGEKQNLNFIIGASSVGTLIEWYDFYLYAILAGLFATKFFPGDLKGSFLYSLAVFWVGFIVRPFGAIIFGHIGDLIGRKYTFMLTLVLMGAATFLVGCLPTYDSIGWLAPVLLVVLRLIQGLALGGEYGGAATYIAEHAPDGKRGMYTGWIQTTATLGIVLSLITIMCFRLGLGDDVWNSYGWRIPFLLSALLVILSGYIRLKLDESPLYAKLKIQGKTSDNPAKETFSSGKSWGMILLALFGATAPEGVIWYTCQFYVLFFLANVAKLPWTEVYIILAFVLLFASPMFVVFGAISDRIGRKPVMLGSMILAVITLIPAFQGLLDHKDNPIVVALIVFYLVLLVTAVYGPIAAFLVEFFPARVRYSSMSLPYHVGNGVFGGGVPLIGTAMATAYGTFAGLWYPMVVAAVGVVVGGFGIRSGTQHVKIWEEVGGHHPAE